MPGRIRFAATATTTVISPALKSNAPLGRAGCAPLMLADISVSFRALIFDNWNNRPTYRTNSTTGRSRFVFPAAPGSGRAAARSAALAAANRSL